MPENIIVMRGLRAQKLGPQIFSCIGSGDDDHDEQQGILTQIKEQLFNITTCCK